MNDHRNYLTFNYVTENSEVMVVLMDIYPAGFKNINEDEWKRQLGTRKDAGYKKLQPQ